MIKAWILYQDQYRPILSQIQLKFMHIFAVRWYTYVYLVECIAYSVYINGGG